MTTNLILSGGVAHDFAATSARVAELLEPLGVNSVIEEDIETGMMALGQDNGYDLVTFNALRWQMLDARYEALRPAQAYSPSSQTRVAFSTFLRTGGALLALHAATICFDDWPEWGEMLGAKWRWGSSSHPPLGPAHVAVQTGADRLVEGIADFETIDEIYGFLEVADDVKPLMHSSHGGVDHPLLWKRRYGMGHIVYDALGHNVRAYEPPSQQELIRRSATWLLTQGSVTQQPPRSRSKME